MILKRGATCSSLSQTFSWLESDEITPYRDASFLPSTFDLHLDDCWQGLAKARDLSWVAMPSSKTPEQWGRYNAPLLAHFEEPAHGDLHEIVPGRLFAFRGPADVTGGGDFVDDPADGYRRLSPAYYAQVLAALGVAAVVRLNEPESYEPSPFAARGIAHLDLPFADCSAPPRCVATAFLRAVDAASTVAVHCAAGLGRTGTLIALHLMLRCGFPARAAVGWLRIVRPGSVVGEQQHYLCAVEAAARIGPRCIPTPPVSPQPAARRGRAPVSKGGPEPGAELARETAVQDQVGRGKIPGGERQAGAARGRAPPALIRHLVAKKTRPPAGHREPPTPQALSGVVA
jgi:cell division cycle 14